METKRVKATELVEPNNFKDLEFVEFKEGEVLAVDIAARTHVLLIIADDGVFRVKAGTKGTTDLMFQCNGSTIVQLDGSRYLQLTGQDKGYALILTETKGKCAVINYIE